MTTQKEDLKIKYCFLKDIKDSPLGKKKLTCYLFDISPKGLGLLMDTVILEGSIIFVKINHKALHIKKDIDAVGKVVRLLPYGDKFIIGVEFLNIKNQDRKRIEKFVSSYIYRRTSRHSYQ